MTAKIVKMLAVPLGAIAAFGLSHMALGQDADSTQASKVEEATDLTQARCRDIMILSGLDRDVTIAFLHGFLVGKSGDATFDSEKLTDSTEVFLHNCLDQPEAKALKVLEAALEE